MKFFKKVGRKLEQYSGMNMIKGMFGKGGSGSDGGDTDPMIEQARKTAAGGGTTGFTYKGLQSGAPGAPA